MSLREDTIQTLRARRQRLIDGGINTIPSPFIRFSNDFLGWEQATMYLFTSYTKGGKSQLVSYLLFEGLLYCYCNEKKTGVSMKILYFPLEETPQRIMTRMYSWLLMKAKKYRISPSDLRSSNNNKPLSEKVLNLLEGEDLTKIIDYFEEHIIFSTESNPTGIYKFCKQYAEDNGKVHTKPAKYRDEMGVLQDTQTFDFYEPNNPNEYVMPLIDTINLVDSERGYTKKQTIDKLSEYLAKYLRNNYSMSPIVIQQQSVENENIENIKLNRTRPSIAGLGDSKYVGRDKQSFLLIHLHISNLFHIFVKKKQDMIKSKIDDVREEFESLFNQGLSDYKIAKILGMNHVTIFQYRKKHGYIRQSLKEAKEIPLTEDNLEVLLGTLLGDSSLRKHKNTRLSCEHGIKQKEYCEYKAALLSNLGVHLRHSKRKTADKRNGKYYESFVLRTDSNSALNYLYDAFYDKGKKVIPFQLFKYFTAKSLAFMFMDDGCKMSNGYTIATNCFTEEEITNFRKFLFNKFNIETSMFKSHVVYIHKKSVETFNSLILPYMCECMKYKLHSLVTS